MPSFFIRGSGRQCGKDHRESVCRRREYGRQLQKGRAAMKGKAGEGYGSRKEEDNSKGRTARAEKSNGDSRKYGPEQCRTERGFRVGRVSEQRRFGLPECGGMRMEIDEFETPAQSAANGVMCAAGGTVVPRDQQCGVLDKVVVTHGITPRMIGRGECHAMIGGSQHTPEAFAVSGREAALLSPERDYGDQPQTGHRRVRKMRVRSRGGRKDRCRNHGRRKSRCGRCGGSKSRCGKRGGRKRGSGIRSGGKSRSRSRGRRKGRGGNRGRRKRGYGIRSRGKGRSRSRGRRKDRDGNRGRRKRGNGIRSGGKGRSRSRGRRKGRGGRKDRSGRKGRGGRGGSGIHGGRKGRSCFGIAAREDRFGGGEVEAHGHAAEEGPEAAGVQLPHRRAQSRSGLAPVSAVAGKSDGGKAVFGHTSKGSVLARTLQDFLLNLKLYTNMKHSANCLASFLGGALVGAVVAMLVTPKSGPEFREDIRDMAKKGTRKLKNEIDKIHCDCNGLDCDCDKDE